MEQMIKVSWVQTAYAIAWLVWLGKNCSKLGNGKKKITGCLFSETLSSGPSRNYLGPLIVFLLTRQFGDSTVIKKLQKTGSNANDLCPTCKCIFFFWKKCNWFPSTSKDDLKQYIVLFCRLVLPSLLDMYLAFLKNLCRYILQIPLWINMS